MTCMTGCCGPRKVGLLTERRPKTNGGLAALKHPHGYP